MRCEAVGTKVPSIMFLEREVPGGRRWYTVGGANVKCVECKVNLVKNLPEGTTVGCLDASPLISKSVAPVLPLLGLIDPGLLTHSIGTKG